MKKNLPLAYELLTAVLMGLCVNFTACAQSYSVIDLGTPSSGFTNSSGNYSFAYGVNSSGSVAGEWAPGTGSQRSFLYAGGTNQDIGLLSGMLYEAAFALNASNLVVGEAYNYSGSIYAFLYTNGTMVDLSVLGPLGYTYSVPHAINDRGVIVGESYGSSALNAQIHAVIFLGNGVTDLGVLPGGNYSTAYGINNSNVIVGESTVISGNITNAYAFMSSNNVMTSLGTLPGGNYSAAFAISDLGQIVGESSTSGGQTNAFLFKNGSMINLGTLGGTASSATGINHAGMVVGYATTTAGDSHAFIYDGSVMRDLNSLISTSVCTNLTYAAGINDSGQIVANGYTTNGDKRAFLLTPVLKLTSPAMLAGPHFQFTVNGLTGQKFILQGSTNLTGWTPLITNTLVTTSTNWTDTNVASVPYRFYRAQAAP